jgi:type I restriction enzyme M protein
MKNNYMHRSHISDSFMELFDLLGARWGELEDADPEDQDECKVKSVFHVSPSARWSYVRNNAKRSDVGRLLDPAMDAIERDNPSLNGALPKVNARRNLDPANLGGLIDTLSNIALGDAKARSTDVQDRVFECFFGEFALAEGRKGGQFYAPISIAELLMVLPDPHQDWIIDPCYGSGNMFAQSGRFVWEWHGRTKKGGMNLAIFGQASSQTTWHLVKMNLDIRAIDSPHFKWIGEGSFLNNTHRGIRAAYMLLNPPFNNSHWSGGLLRSDTRWHYGAPFIDNANFAWLQHFAFRLAPADQAGVILGEGALTSKGGDEGKLDNASALIPAEGELINMSESVGLFIEKNISNRIHTRTLENLRDALMPKRMSGEVSVL